MSTAKPATPTPVDALLPHTGAMRLVDALLDFDAEQVRVALTVRDTPPFGDGCGAVPAYVGIEYMAQTVCVFSGLEMRARGLPPKIGLLIGTRRYDAVQPAFAHGAQLTVAARLVLRDEQDLCVFACAIHDAAGHCLARAEVKAYRPDDIRQYLEPA